ncbi:hypothetical protein M9435_006745 [Picochlorum sp. BPE23]|nr:hypothetical protein M9435_006745 [Picochlorum sp. BPE23]
MASMTPMRIVSASRARGLLCQRPKLAVIIIAMIVVASTYLLQDNSWHDLYLHDRANRFPLAKASSLEFVKYIPSELEQDWWHQRQIYQANPSRICQDLDKYSDKVSRWISSTQDNDIPDQSVFSKLQYRKNNGEKVLRMIEPLVGHFRHPFALQHCKPAAKPAVDAQDRSYIAFGGLQELDKNVYPGKKYLFDLGTADFATSIGYFISTYHSLGIDFDRIWAWEAGPKPDYWKSVPDEVQGRLHFYNYPISSDTQSPSHPLEILKSIYMPGDYIVRLVPKS